MSHRGAWLLLTGALAVLLCLNCGRKSPTAPAPTPTEGPRVVPVVPIPSSVDDLLPLTSDTIAVGISDGVSYIAPIVQSYRQVNVAGTPVWIDRATDVYLPRALLVVCGGALVANSAEVAIGRTYLTELPRFLHRRFWKRAEGQMVMTPGTSQEFSVSVQTGKETTDGTVTGWSNMFGVSTAWGAGGAGGTLSGSLDFSYQHTDTYSEMRSVSFHTDSTVTTKYAVACPAGNMGVYAVWQLMDVFEVTDSNGLPIDRWTGQNVVVSPVPPLEIPSGVVRLQLTLFPITSAGGSPVASNATRPAR